MIKKKRKSSYLSKISKKLSSIDKRISSIQKEENKIEKEEERINKKLITISKEEEHIEKTIIKIGNLELKRKHLYELVRASAGAFLGVGLGRGLLGLDTLAKNLSWFNVIGILAFVLIISSILIYKDQRVNIEEKGKRIIFQRLFFIYLISVLMEYISILLFNVSYDSFGNLLKILIVGSYTAMASAVTFSLAK